MNEEPIQWNTVDEPPKDTEVNVQNLNHNQQATPILKIHPLSTDYLKNFNVAKKKAIELCNVSEFTSHSPLRCRNGLGAT